ncbi:MAG TPA: glycosyltransferase [Kineosporiaceae bacterium]|nr:glycosyltransferase [Kineosporiaceae bacterium]
MSTSGSLQPRSFSAIIPTRDRPGDLAACLRSVTAADNGRLREIIVIDDGSRVPCQIDSALVRVPVQLIRHETSQGPDRCRNTAVEAALGDDMAFLDDDARLPQDWFTIASTAVDAGWQAFTGRVLPFDHGIVSRARQWRYDQRYSALFTGQTTSFLAGGNSVVDRKAFRNANGFPILAAGGDNGLVSRLAGEGVDCRFLWDLRVLHRNSKGLGTAAKQAWRAGLANPAPSRRIAFDEFSRSLQALRSAPADIGLLNGSLQLMNTAGRMVARSTT